MKPLSVHKKGWHCGKGPQQKGKGAGGLRRGGTGSEDLDKMREKKKEMTEGTVFILYLVGKI